MAWFQFAIAGLLIGLGIGRLIFLAQMRLRRRRMKQLLRKRLDEMGNHRKKLDLTRSGLPLS